MVDTSHPEDRFRLIEQIYHQTLERPEEERRAYLAQACAGDDELRREVEGLLSFDNKAGSFIESPALDVAAKALARNAELGRKINLIGQTIFHYKVLEKIDEGGMGVVYKAVDTDLQRPVAIKILPPEIVGDRERRRRFVQEARAASALNHPNIITIYDIDQVDGTDFIAMEYVCGKTLAELIPRKGMKLTDTLKYSIQIADALAGAHAAGIVHRDLKPANVMVTETGLVKVLDFGLAKLTERADKDESGTTETLEPRTEEGTILGTVSYMSPEQAEGKKVDARSDIFSLGSVLYEMVTGQKAFQGTSKPSTLSAILHQEPKPISGITPAIPADLEKLINRCLRKDPQRRWQNMADIKVALEDLKEESDSGKLAAGAPARRRGRPYLRLSMILAAGAIVAAATWLWRSRILTTKAPMAPVPFTTYRGLARSNSFSPDGEQVAFAWDGEKLDNVDIYIKQIGSESPRRLTTDPHLDDSPAWSPNGLTIAFERFLDSGKTAVMRIPANGGRERPVAEFHTLFVVSWHPGGKWLAVASADSPGDPSAIVLLSLGTGERRRLTFPPQAIVGDRTPAFSPDGRQLAFSRCYGTDKVSEILVLQVSADIRPEGEPRQLTFGDRAAKQPTWTPDGKELVFTFGSLHYLGLYRISTSGSDNPRRLPFSGEFAQAGGPSVSLENNRLLYYVMSLDINLWRHPIPRDAGKPDAVVSRLVPSSQLQEHPQYSPDGKEVAYVSYASGNSEIWISSSDGSNPTQLTHFGGPMPENPRWSPDGKRIVFSMSSRDQNEVFVIPVRGGQAKQLTHTPFNKVGPSYSWDGNWIYFGWVRAGDSQIWKMPVEGGEPVQVTRNGGSFPQESMDGRTLFYLKEGGGLSSLWMVPVGGGKETKIADGVQCSNFDVKERGIYYTSIEKRRPRTLPTRMGGMLLYYDLASGGTRTLAPIEGDVQYGFSVSPDEEWFLLTKGDRPPRSDLMLVENFR